MNKKYKVLIFVLAFFTLGIFVFPIVKRIFSFANDFEFVNPEFDSEDSLIFNEESLKLIEVKSITKSSIRNALKIFKYKKEYIFFITKVNLKHDLALDKILSPNMDFECPSLVGDYFKPNVDEHYDVNFKIEENYLVSKIFFSMKGDKKQLKQIKYSDNFYSYNLPLESFVMKYNRVENAPDIFIKSKNSNVSFIVSFYKKGKSIYLILMSPINEETKMSENILGEFINYDGNVGNPPN